MKNKIWGNTIVKNEDRYIWFAVMSVIDYLDKMIIWDTGSTDNTVEIIKEIKKRKGDKIEFLEYGEVDEQGFTKARQEMLDQTKGDWVFILDGDEVWWENSIKNIKTTIEDKGDKLDLIVNPCYNVVGDIYHYQDEAAGKYKLLGREGHLNIRAINRNIPGLHVDKPYGSEGYFDQDNVAIQDRDPKRMIFLDNPYMHFTHLQRSSGDNGDSKVMQRSRKLKFEIGNKFAPDFKYPEVFYEEYPSVVPDPWQKMSNSYKLKAAVRTPLIKLKRMFVK